jgi:hypothetical protein
MLARIHAGTAGAGCGAIETDMDAQAHGSGVVVVVVIVIEQSDHDHDHDHDHESLPDGISVTTSVPLAPVWANGVDHDGGKCYGPNI